MDGKISLVLGIEVVDALVHPGEVLDLLGEELDFDLVGDLAEPVLPIHLGQLYIYTENY